MCKIKEACKEGRSPFLFKDEIPHQQEHGPSDSNSGDGDDKSISSHSPSYLELRSALARSNSELEEQQAADSLEELAALAREDKMSEPKPVPKASSSKISPESINALLQIVQQKMKKQILLLIAEIIYCTYMM